MTFDGDPFGIKIVNSLIRQAPDFLRPGGWLAFEVGLRQGPSLAKKPAKNKIWSAVR